MTSCRLTKTELKLRHMVQKRSSVLYDTEALRVGVRIDENAEDVPASESQSTAQRIRSNCCSTLSKPIGTCLIKLIKCLTTKLTGAKKSSISPEVFILKQHESVNKLFQSSEMLLSSETGE